MGDTQKHPNLSNTQAPGDDRRSVQVHIVPSGKDGKDVWFNLSLPCGPCNRGKALRLTIDDLCVEIRSACLMLDEDALRDPDAKAIAKPNRSQAASVAKGRRRARRKRRRSKEVAGGLGAMTMRGSMEDRIQAEEEIWCAVVQALRAVAEDRGWRHDSGATIEDVATQLGKEQGCFTAYDNHLSSASPMHRYLAPSDWGEIEWHRKDAIEFISKLQSDLNRPPRSFTIQDDDDQWRLGRLLDLRLPGGPAEWQQMLDRELPRGTTSAQGFSPRYGYRRRRTRQQPKGEAMATKKGRRRGPVERPPRYPAGDSD